MSVEPARPGDLDAIHGLLASCGLPTEDVTAGSLSSQFVARSANAVVGTVGLDCLGVEGYLRSLAVAEGQRQGGLGSRLCDEAEAAARRKGVRHVYLQTETAEKFFARRGYRTVDRAALPATITGVRQVTSGCCGGATCMVKDAHPTPR